MNIEVIYKYQCVAVEKLFPNSYFNISQQTAMVAK